MAKLKKFRIERPIFEVEMKNPIIGRIILIRAFFIGVKLFTFDIGGMKTIYILTIPKFEVI